MYYFLRKQASGAFFVFFITILFGLITFAVLYLTDQNSLLYYGDAVSHLYSARRFFDSTDPGLGQLGTVWLPLPHVIMLPFTMVDPLFSSGVAGAIVNLPLHALSAVMIYKIVLVQVRKNWVALVGAFLFALNPNLLYLANTAMTETSFIFFFVAAAYFLQKALVDHSVNLRHMIISAAFVSLATLSRYEGWVLSLAISGFAVFYLLKERNRAKLVVIVPIVLLGFSGIMFWTGWNYVAYDDPLEFADAQFYSASSQAVERPHRDFLYLQPDHVAYVYGLASFMILGPFLLIVAALGLYWSYKRHRYRTNLVYLFMILPVAFTLFTLLVGIGEMSQYWFNARFATFLVPIAVVLACIGIDNLSLARTKRTVILVFLLFVFPLTIPFGVVTYLDAYSGWSHKQAPYGIEVSEFLKENYEGGKIVVMTGSAQAHRIIVPSGFALTEFEEITESWMYKEAFREPWNEARWVVMGKEPDSDAKRAVEFWNENMGQLREHYSLVYENKFYKVFKLD